MGKIINISDKDMAEIRRLGGDSNSPIRWSNISAAQRRYNQKVAQYEDYVDALQFIINSRDPKDIAALAESNEKLARLNNLIHKDVLPGVVHQDASLTNLSVQYANEEYIGEQLMPVLTVNKLTDLYYTYGQRDRFAYPDDMLGPRGDANEINETRDHATYACIGYGYENYVDADTIYDQDAPLNEMVDLVQAIAEGLAFRRELRIAAIAGAAGSYGANTVAIAAGNRWNTPTHGDPIGDILTGLAALWTGRGPSDIVGFCSLDVYNVLARHPQILDLFKYGGTSPGLATPSMIAQFMGFDRLLIGKARQDTANEAAAAVYARVWPNVFGIVRVMRRPSIRNAAFGLTFRHRDLTTTQWFDQSKGVHGGWFARTAVSETHDVIAPLTGYLITTPI